MGLQVTVHYRLKNELGETTHVTECFECVPKQSRNKTYPVCTIRNTPDKPIHCIVWAKELLFARLFGRCCLFLCQRQLWQRQPMQTLARWQSLFVCKLMAAASYIWPALSLDQFYLCVMMRPLFVVLIYRQGYTCLNMWLQARYCD